MNIKARRNIMKMVVAGVLYILICNVGYGESHEIDEIVRNLILDVTNTMYHARFSVTAFLCSTTDDLNNFSEFLSKNYKLHTILMLSKDYFLTLNDFELSHTNFYVFDLDCSASHELLIEVNEKGMFSAPGKWLMLQDSRLSRTSINETHLKNIFGNLSIFPDSEVTIALRIEDTAVKLLSIYRPNLIADLTFEDRGMWNQEKGIQLQNNDESSRRRTNIMQLPLRAAAVITHPNTMNHWEDCQEKRVDAVSKVGYAFTKLLAARMNTTVNFTFTPSWGYKSPNGTWDGIVAGLIRDEIDLGGTGMFITEHRIGVISYINLYTPSRVRFVFRRPPLSYVSNLFVLPFARNVWIATTLFCSFGYIILYL
ncbi:uncharacterized protein, partial [Fopius arisanus]|uniref:Ionotropic receptor 75a N-terminal domain-containing protein n=1 Tax=Fopius arisanus TaxID=64838 RepID=A0A9R1TR94_9HYME